MRLGRRFLSVAATIALAVAFIPSGPAAAAAPWDSGGVVVLRPVASDAGVSIRNAPPTGQAQESAERVMQLRSGNGHGKPGGGGGGGTADGALQTSAAVAPATTAGVNVDGVGVGITSTYKDCCTPPDTNLAVGTSEVVQWVNLDFAVFDKATGALVSGYPQAGKSIWSGFGASGCANNNDGDPIVKFDAQNQRWIMTQFSVSTTPYLQCVAVSNGPTFAGATWNRYAYSFGNLFPDYPKVGIWPDGYYFSFNMFQNGATFSGAYACALDGAAARAGASASMQCFNTGYASLLPADLDGATGATGSTQLPPAGAAGYFMNFGSNALRMWRMHVNFADSTQTTLAGPTTFGTAAFSQACGGGTCVPQAGTSQKLDSLADRLMYRLSYRNFGSYESLVVSHSVAGSGTAAPRWYELRNSGTGYGIYQQSSYAPDATYRWMSSAAQDKQGNLAIGYSASSTGISPDIRYAGRVASDPLGQLRAEVIVPLGSHGSETGPYSRWGDYSSMTLDPVDDCTFWYTTMYYKTTGGSFTWSTRMVNFKFSGCN